eukprot:jgi/Undpi1/2727/HiC_scaffold_14.g06105.m1
MAGVRAAFNKIPSGGGPLLPLLNTAIVLGAVGYCGYNSVFTVDGGHRAIIFNRLTGVKEGVMSEGMHFVVPWFEWPYIYDVRTKPRNVQSLTGSKDLQMVSITLRVLSKPDPSKLPFIYRRLGKDYDERVLPSIVNEVTKAVVAKYNASELLTKREAVSKNIRDALQKRARDFGIVMEDTAITHLSFSREYTAAVEAKQASRNPCSNHLSFGRECTAAVEAKPAAPFVALGASNGGVAQQDSERAKYVVDKARQEKMSIVIKAEGEAQSAKLVGEAIKDNPGFIQLRRIDAARDIATTVARSNNKLFLNTDSLLLDLVGGQGDSDIRSSMGKPAKAKSSWR